MQEKGRLLCRNEDNLSSLQPNITAYGLIKRWSISAQSHTQRIWARCMSTLLKVVFLDESLFI